MDDQAGAVKPKGGRQLLPHQLRIASGNVLVLIPGRDPLCLLCEGTGHIRRECRVPRCDECHPFGHERENCVRTYATVTQEVVADGDCVLSTDEEEAEMAARDVETKVSAAAGAKEAPAAVPKEVHPPQLQPGGDAMKPDPSQASSSRPVATSDVRVSILKDVEATQAPESKDRSQVSLSDDNSNLSDASETIIRPGEASARSEFKWHKN